MPGVGRERGVRSFLLCALLPLCLVIFFDQLSKHIAASLEVERDLGWLKLTLHHNSGFMLGSLRDLSKLYTVVIPSTIGAFLLFVFLCLQFFAPLRFASLKVGLSILTGGFLANIVDRVSQGAVVDFILVQTRYFNTGIFNLADVCQWIGAAVFLSSFLYHGSLLYPAHERRGRKWIDPKFQAKFCSLLLLVGFGFATIGGVLAYTFLKITITETSWMSPEARWEVLASFRIFYGMAISASSVGLFVFGVYFSHKIVGPVKGFEGFLDDLLLGRAQRFRVRRGDDLGHLEQIADRYYEFFHGRLGIEQAPLERGDFAPNPEMFTYQGQGLDIGQYHGRRIWMIFYRYATCPLCAYHLDEISSAIRDLQKKGLVILAVFESRPADFIKGTTGDTSRLLSSLDIPLISDPQRQIYRRFKTRQNAWALLRANTWTTFFRARRKNFRQDSIDGVVGQLPAHFLIDEEGRIRRSFYGRHFNDHIPIAEVEQFVEA